LFMGITKMTKFQILLEMIEKLEVAFNTKHIKKTNLASIWAEEFKDVSPSRLEKAVEWWIKHNDRFPTIHQLHQAINKVGGSEAGKKQEFYSWVDKETMDDIPVVYYFKVGPHIYSCVLEKNRENMPPESFMTKYGVRAYREDIWEKEYGKTWKLERLKEMEDVRKKEEKPLKKDIAALKERVGRLLKAK